MAKVGAQRAAELTKRSKSTIQRAMKAGKLSYEVDNNGRRVIDVAELDRAFGLMPQDGGAGQASVEAELEKAAQTLEVERLKMRIRLLEDQVDMAKEQIDDLKEQRDQWQKQAQQVLLTSQYSQKQAEELKEEIKERDRRARIRRQQEMQRRGAGTARVVPGGVENRKDGSALISAADKLKREAKNFDIQGLWGKFRSQNQNTTAPAAAPVPAEAAGVNAAEAVESAVPAEIKPESQQAAA